MLPNYRKEMYLYNINNIKAKQNNMKKLTVTSETFNNMLSGFIQSGVTFDAIETPQGIEITFTGGY